MRIAFILHRFPSISETFILRQITGLIDLGHDVTVYSERTADSQSIVHPEFEKYRLRDRVVYLDTQMPVESGIWSMPVWPITGETWIPGAEQAISNMSRILAAVPALRACLDAVPELAISVLDPQQHGAQATTLEALYHLAQLLKENRRFDVVHAHFGPVGRNFAFIPALWRVPFVVSFHGYDFCTFPRTHGTKVYDRLFAVADAVTVNSDYTLGRVRALGCADAKLVKLPVGLDPREFPFQQRILARGAPVRLLTVARLVEIKGHEHALRAVAIARQNLANLRYDIVGEGPLRPKLETLIQELNLSDTVVLHGALDGEQVRRLMNQAHVFLLCSVDIDGDQEGQGLVLQEAQACGLPVIATNHGAFPEGLIDGLSGFLVPERDIRALAERILYLADHPDLWQTMGNAGRAFVTERYDVRQLNRRLVQLYQQLIGRSVQPR
jgi:colanic acid/amylovoran biosynthesis glycosyltransferase